MNSIIASLLSSLSVKALSWLANLITPIVFYLIDRGILKYNTSQGKKLYDKLIKAEVDGNEEDYNNIMDDI